MTSVFGNKIRFPVPAQRQSYGSKMRGIGFKKSLFGILLIIGFMIACDFLSFLIPVNKSSDVPTSMRSLLANVEQEGKEMTLSEALGDLYGTFMDKRTKWRFESIKQLRVAEKKWQFGDQPMRKQYFEGKIFEVIESEFAPPPRENLNKMAARRRYTLRSVENENHFIEIRDYWNNLRRTFFLDLSSKRPIYHQLDLNAHKTIVVQVLSDVPSRTQRRIPSINHDYPDEVNLDFSGTHIKEIRDVSIRASNGMFLEWKHEANNHQITATAHNNKAPNSQWILSFERAYKHRKYVRIWNVAKGLADDAAFIRHFGEAVTLYDVKGYGDEYSLMIIKQAGNTGSVTIEGDAYLCIDQSTGKVISTNNSTNQDALFEIFVGETKLTAPDFQQSTADETDVIDVVSAVLLPTNTDSDCVSVKLSTSPTAATGEAAQPFEDETSSGPISPTVSFSSALFFGEDTPRSTSSEEMIQNEKIEAAVDKTYRGRSKSSRMIPLLSNSSTSPSVVTAPVDDATQTVEGTIPIQDEKVDAVANKANRGLLYGFIIESIVIAIACTFCILFALMKRREGSRKKSVQSKSIRLADSPNQKNKPMQIKIKNDASFKVKPLNEWKSDKMTKKSDDELFEVVEGDDVMSKIGT